MIVVKNSNYLQAWIPFEKLSMSFKAFTDSLKNFNFRYFIVSSLAENFHDRIFQRVTHTTTNGSPNMNKRRITMYD